MKRKMQEIQEYNINLTGKELALTVGVSNVNIVVYNLDLKLNRKLACFNEMDRNRPQ